MLSLLAIKRLFLLPSPPSLLTSLLPPHQVQGLGPLFRLMVSLQNTSPSSCASDLVLLFQWNDSLYSLQQPVIEVRARVLDSV